MFILTEEQSKKISKWKKEVDNKRLVEQKNTMSKEDFDFLTQGGKYPYSGAIGGSITYSFTSTSLGEIVKVTSFGEELDVTDYDMW